MCVYSHTRIYEIHARIFNLWNEKEDVLNIYWYREGGEEENKVLIMKGWVNVCHFDDRIVIGNGKSSS